MGSFLLSYGHPLGASGFAVPSALSRADPMDFHDPPSAGSAEGHRRVRCYREPHWNRPLWHKPYPFSAATVLHTQREATLADELREYVGYSLEATVDDAKARGVDLRVLTRKFSVGSAELTCWQFRPYSHPDPSGWSVFCGTSANIPLNDFSATFDGREEELSTFYEIIAGVKPVE